MCVGVSRQLGECALGLLSAEGHGVEVEVHAVLGQERLVSALLYLEMQQPIYLKSAGRPQFGFNGLALTCPWMNAWQTAATAIATIQPSA